jgi:hypothetical protein
MRELRQERLFGSLSVKKMVIFFPQGADIPLSDPAEPRNGEQKAVSFDE